MSGCNKISNIKSGKKEPLEEKNLTMSFTQTITYLRTSFHKYSMMSTYRLKVYL